MPTLRRADILERLPRGSALRIALVIERFAPGAGGVEQVAWRFAHELARSGDEVTVITRDAADRSDDSGECAASEGTASSVPGSEDAEAFVSSRPRVRRLQVPGAWQPLRVAAFSLAAAREVGRGDYDVVHAFGRTRHQHLYRAGGGSHADYLRRTHDARGRALRQLSPRHRVLLSIESRVFADPRQRIQCASRLVANTLVARHGVAEDRILLVPNAVDAGRYATPEARAAGAHLRQRLDEKAERIWLFPASGWRRKGLVTLLDALARHRDPLLHVWVAGRDDPGPWRRRAAARGVLDRVRFLGHRGDLPDVYAAVDGMVLPTRYDAFANVTLEAAAAGLPIVTSRANGAAEWLGDAVHCLDAASDAEAIAQALRTLADPEPRHALGARARRVAEGLDWASHVAVLRDEYRRIARMRRRSVA
jgi:UDP-glucose:(heptosyl)LPS alpha-1,3-glucosyltransferase